MKLQYLEIHYLASKLFDPDDEDSWYFEVKAKDIENKYNSGNEFYFVYYNTRPQNSEIYQYIKNNIKNGVINVSEIKFRESQFTLTQKKQFKINEISFEKNDFLNNGNVKFKNDVFDIDDTSLLRISGTIQDWRDQIDNGLDETVIVQKWISQSNKPVDLTFGEYPYRYIDDEGIASTGGCLYFLPDAWVMKELNREIVLKRCHEIKGDLAVLYGKQNLLLKCICNHKYGYEEAGDKAMVWHMRDVLDKAYDQYRKLLKDFEEGNY